jgi:hypothetical protein
MVISPNGDRTTIKHSDFPLRYKYRAIQKSFDQVIIITP